MSRTTNYRKIRETDEDKRLNDIVRQSGTLLQTPDGIPAYQRATLSYKRKDIKAYLISGGEWRAYDTAN